VNRGEPSIHLLACQRAGLRARDEGRESRPDSAGHRARAPRDRIETGDLRVAGGRIVARGDAATERHNGARPA
jgi:hypothetical protein